MGAPIRYAGGKSLAVGLIIERIPDDVKRVVSPFLGGGSVEVAIANELDIPVVGYDIFDILTNYLYGRNRRNTKKAGVIKFRRKVNNL